MAATSKVAPRWPDVEDEIRRLAESRDSFATALSPANRIASYEPGRRIQLETERGPTWIEIESIQSCWETFERLRKIRRSDVLEPGRCSAFMMALFSRLPGVSQEEREETYLVLPRR